MRDPGAEVDADGQSGDGRNVTVRDARITVFDPRVLDEDDDDADGDDTEDDDFDYRIA